MLRQLFEPHAKVVHTAVITEPGSGVSRGFGFVHIPDPAQVSWLRMGMPVKGALTSTIAAHQLLASQLHRSWYIIVAAGVVTAVSLHKAALDPWQAALLFSY